MQRFHNKVVLVTGAASGIGRATAEQFAAEGAALLLCDINRAGLDELAQTLALGPERLQVRELDVSDSAACAQAVEAAVQAFGQLDVLCNIAGIALAKHFTDTSDAEWRRVQSINLDGVFYLCRAAMPHLIASGGNIVNMASSAGLVGQAYSAAYCAAKAGVVMLSKSLAIEYAARGVRVNAICPGGVKTPLAAGFEMPAQADAALFARMSPLLPMAEPQDIARSIAYMASDDARFMTGAALSVDGGQTAG